MEKAISREKHSLYPVGVFTTVSVVKNVIKITRVLGFQPLIAPCRGEGREFTLSLGMSFAFAFFDAFVQEIFDLPVY